MTCSVDAPDSDAPKGKSVVVRDLKTKEIVLVVFRNFLADRPALLLAQEVVEGVASV